MSSVLLTHSLTHSLRLPKLLVLDSACTKPALIMDLYICIELKQTLDSTVTTELS